MQKTSPAIRIGNKLVDGLLASFAEHAEAAIVRVRQERPADYLKIVAALCPGQVEVSGGPFDGVTDAELEALIALVST